MVACYLTDFNCVYLAGKLMTKAKYMFLKELGKPIICYIHFQINKYLKWLRKLLDVLILIIWR